MIPSNALFINLKFELKMKYAMVCCGIWLLLGACTTPKATQSNGAGNAEKATEKQASLMSRSKFLDNGSSLKVYVSIESERLQNSPDPMAAFRKDFSVSYSLQADYASRQSLGSGVVSLSDQQVAWHRGEMIVAFDLPKPKDLYTGVVMITINDNAIPQGIVNDLYVRFNSGKMGDYFAVFDKTGRFPIMRNYINAKDTLMLKDLNGTSRKLVGLRYRHEFDPALPPTAISPRAVTKTMYIDSVYQLPTNVPLILNEKSLYYICRDTSESYGIGLVTVDPRYPRLTRPESLAKPPIYISTTSEVNDLYASSDAKRALDRYWLGLTSGNQTVAKRAIRLYYRRVETANKLYTTYKEGWKTDKGMVYVIMGAPDKQQRSKDKEIWTYAKRGQYQEINFTFTKRPNQFVEDHYELNRYVEYQPIWFPVVEAWRSGEIEK